MVKAITEWLPEALAAAHSNKEAKSKARLVLGVHSFTVNLRYYKCWDPLKDALRTRLTALGRPLREAFEREGQQAALGSMQDELQLHPLAQGGAKKLRLDLAGIMPVPKQWGLDGLERSQSERAYIHMFFLSLFG